MTGDVGSHRVVASATPPRQAELTRHGAVVEEHEALVGGADVEGEELEAGRHVEVGHGAAGVAGESGPHGGHHVVVRVGDVVDAEQVLPERVAQVGAAGGNVAGEVQGRVAAVERLHAGEGEGVPDGEAPA